MTSNSTIAHYFPVTPRPLVMKAGFQNLGTDFGNGEQDRAFFQKDEQFSLYQRVKQQINPKRYWATTQNRQHVLLHLTALEWIIQQQYQELGNQPQRAHLELCKQLKEWTLSHRYPNYLLSSEMSQTLFQTYHS